jgi:hypothetical protein
MFTHYLKVRENIQSGKFFEIITIMCIKYFKHSLPESHALLRKKSFYHEPSTQQLEKKVKHFIDKIMKSEKKKKTITHKESNKEYYVSVSDLYISRISPHISCSRIGRDA